MIRLYFQNSLSRLTSLPRSKIRLSNNLWRCAGSLAPSETPPPSYKFLNSRLPLANLSSGLVHFPRHDLTVRMFRTCASNLGKKSEDSDQDPSLAWTRDGKVYDKGPDQIVPSTVLRTWHPKGAVKLKVTDREMENLKPISVPTLLTSCAARGPDLPAMMIKRENNVWQKWTYGQYLQDVRTAAKAFIALGLEPHHSVCILGFNSPEWFIANFGAIFAGGFAAGIYTTNSAEACAHCAVDSEANIFVVDDEIQLAKILKIRHQLPNLKAIIQYNGKPSATGVLSWEDFMLLGNQPDDLLEARLKNIAINQCCTLIYTSGTTGNPKGVMLTHDNLSWMSVVSRRWSGFKDANEEMQEVVISFLPLSHIAAQMADLYCPLSCSALVGFPDTDALKGTLVDNMKEILPTKFLGVPRVWEKMHDKMSEVGRNTKGVKKVIGDWAKAEGLKRNVQKMDGLDYESLGFKIAKKLVFTKVKEALGFSRCDFYLSGAAPLSNDILLYFMSLDILVTEAYGLSECTGPHTMAIGNAFRLGSVGKTMTGCTTKIIDPRPDGTGEIVMGGRHITMGYLNQRDLTEEAIDDDGCMHTGDIGRVDKDGFLFITGRLKEILITAGGENVAPVPIEDRIKTQIPAVSQAVVLGDKLKFLSVLLTLKTEVDQNTQEPLNKLMRVSKDWVEKNGNCSVDTIQDVRRELYEKKNIKLLMAFENGITEVNKNVVSHAQIIQKWVVLPMDFSIPGGEIGPTLKLKRKIVYRKYADFIEGIYKE